jgi:hypothetical protein
MQGERAEVVAAVRVLAHEPDAREAREIAVRAARIELGGCRQVLQRERAVGFLQHFEQPHAGVHRLDAAALALFQAIFPRWKRSAGRSG